MEEDSAAACLHLSNTVLIDRALIIARSRHGELGQLVMQSILSQLTVHVYGFRIRVIITNDTVQA